MNPAVIRDWPEDDPAGMDAAGDLAVFATDVAAIIATRCRHVPESSRKELAEYIRDGISNAIWDAGGSFDGAVFMALAGFVDPNQAVMG
jgi:L-aminopeptidase/D-esterase-like protein